MTEPQFDLLAAVAAAERKRRRTEVRTAVQVLARLLLWPWR